MTRSSSGAPGAAVARRGDQRQAMPVGGDHAHFLRPQHQQRAVQEVARVLAGDGELGLRDHLPGDVARQDGVAGPRAVRHGREVVPRHGLQARFEPVGRDLDAVLVLLDEDVGVRQRLDDLEELLGRQGQRARLLDLGRAAALEPDLEVGRRQAHLRPFGVDQDVGEDGNRVLALDDALEELQFPQQIRLANGEFHACAAPKSRTEAERTGPNPAACSRTRVAVLCLRTNLRTLKYNKNKGLLKSGNESRSPSSSITYGSGRLRIPGVSTVPSTGPAPSGGPALHSWPAGFPQVPVDERRQNQRSKATGSQAGHAGWPGWSTGSWPGGSAARH